MLKVQNQQFNLLINGQCVLSKGKQFFDLINPSTGEVFCQAANARAEDINTAIHAARDAFDQGPWPKLSWTERGVYLKKMAQLIRQHARELADLESIQCGKTLKQSTFIDVPTSADCFEYFGSLQEQLLDRTNPIEASVKSVTRFEPLGVVAVLIPWNYPLIMTAWKLAPALMAGNTVVLKPSSLGCASLLYLGQLLESLKLPQGVVNIVTTQDHEAAGLLIDSPDVNMVSFTGGTESGQHLMQRAAKTVKKISLELGGKSPNIVFADCDFEAAMGGTLSAIFMNQGQMCTAGSRLLLEESIYDQFLNKLIEQTQSLVIGDALNYQTQFGPIISRGNRDKILQFIKLGQKQGAKIVCGGKIPEGEEYSKGFYLEPTILVDVDPSSPLAQEEIFGPVLCVFKFKTEEEAVKLANHSSFGLAGCVWSQDLNKARRVGNALQTGTVWINTYGGFYNESSFGGYKQSGFGRTLGVEGLLEYTQTKHVCVDQTPSGKPLVVGWF